MSPRAGVVIVAFALLAGCAGDPPQAQESSRLTGGGGAITGDCVVTGCSDQICSDQLVETECYESAQNRCFDSAICERAERTGSCSWRPNNDLSICLARAAMEEPGPSSGRGTGSGARMGGADAGMPPPVARDGGMPTEPPRPPTSACMRTGDFGEICAASAQPSTGPNQPIYACYQTAPCEVQASGQCGFTPSLLLNGCIWLVQEITKNQ